MSYYFVANIKVNDETGYREYIKQSGEIFSKYNGEYLAVDDNPEVLEGKWQYTRTIIIKFETKGDFESWYNSREYQEILKYRLSAADCDTILVKGLWDTITSKREQITEI
ncbi:MAG: DUF1330 domain-containing protein [Ignavibacteria bacterium]|nr:DUF1330 domain-containing protein [Ignavibacteria bacterium]